jgi:hypothetical protein
VSEQVSDDSLREIGGYLSEAEESAFRASMAGERACMNCKFWEDFDSPVRAMTALGMDVDYDGWCKRNPPSLPTAEVLAEGMHDAAEGVHPWTRHSDWCGEYQPKEEAKAIVTTPVEVPAHLAEAQRKVIAGALARKNTDYLQPTDY